MATVYRAWHTNLHRFEARLSETQCDPDVVAALAALEPEITERIRNLKEFSPDVRDLLGRQSRT